jgi:hypothetical protein
MSFSLETELHHAPGTVGTPEIVGSVALLVVAGVHLMDLSSKFSEVPYLGIGYAGLVVASVMAIVLLVRGDRRGWLLGGGLALATLIGFILSRTTGLPASTDDIGNWSEPAAIVAFVAEAAVVALAARSLRARRI